MLVNQYKNLCHKVYRLKIKLNFSYSIHNYTIYHLFGNIRQTNKPKDSHILLGKGNIHILNLTVVLQIKPCDYMNQSGSCNKCQILLVKNSEFIFLVLLYVPCSFHHFYKFFICIYICSYSTVVVCKFFLGHLSYKNMKSNNAL